MGVQQGPSRAAGQRSGSQISDSLFHLAPRSRGRVGQQLNSREEEEEEGGKREWGTLGNNSIPSHPWPPWTC